MPEEFFTISKSKHILAAGSYEKITFWYFFGVFFVKLMEILCRDLRVMKERFAFSDSHADDVTKIQFHPENQTLLLSCSLGGILCLFDLAKENEEDAIESSEFARFL